MKKTTAFLLAAAMLISLTPQVSFAAQYGIGDSNTRDSETKIVDSNDDMSLQIVDEFVQDILLYTFPLTEDYFAREIIDAFNTKYKELIDYVTEHPDEVEYDGFWVGMYEGVYSRIETLEMIAGLSKDVYNGEKDLQALKDTVYKRYNSIVKEVRKSDYNSWYWDRYMMLKKDAKARIDAITDLDTYTYACEADLYSVMYYYLDDEDEWEIIWFDDDISDAISEYMYEYDLGYNSIITKEDIRGAIRAGQKELNGLLKKVKKEKTFTPSKSLQKKMKGFTKKASKIEDLMVIAEYYRSILDEFYDAYNKALEEQAGPDESEELSFADMTRWEDQMLKYILAKDHNDYSPKKYRQLINAYYDYADEIDICETQNEAQKVWDKFVKAVAKIPTLKKEIRVTKAKYIKTWKKHYIGQKAYNQKKAKKAYKAGVKALNKATKVEDLTAAYKKHTKKLEQTINRFKVKVLKSGKGTVSGSKTVKYGDKFKLQITPAPGHSLKSVTINGKSQKLKYSYSIKITKATRVKVVFR